MLPRLPDILRSLADFLSILPDVLSRRRDVLLRGEDVLPLLREMLRSSKDALAPLRDIRAIRRDIPAPLPGCMVLVTGGDRAATVSRCYSCPPEPLCVFLKVTVGRSGR
jgi:hypothetical protein